MARPIFLNNVQYNINIFINLEHDIKRGKVISENLHKCK